MFRGKQMNCAYCDKENLSKDVIGLNKKLINPQIKRMMCLTCLAAYFETREELLQEIVDGFKQQGCELFG
jgi:hypothetical protein